MMTVAFPALAQEPPRPEPQVELSEVVVSGTRIRRVEGQAATLTTTTVAPEELLARGEINIGDALNDLPPLRATWSQANSSRFIGTAGLNWLDLRGLGPERTLVLVNNRRHVTSSPGDNFVDVNTMPASLIERVDLVTGGNSAVYGSDAVAGVVNVMTRRDIEGLSIKAQSGQSSRDDRESVFVSLIAGRNFAEGRGNVALAVEWDSTNALYFRQREPIAGSRTGRRFFMLSEDPSDDPGGSDGIIDNPFYDGGLYDGTIAAGGLIEDGDRIFTFDAGGNLVETIPELDLRPFGPPVVRLAANPGGLVSYTEAGQLAPELDRYSANLLANRELSGTSRLFVEAKFAHVDVAMTGGPSLWRGSIDDYFTYPANPLFTTDTVLRCGNAFLSAQALGVLHSLGRCATPDEELVMSRMNFDFGNRGERHDRDTYRVVAGFDGEFQNGWHYEVAANYGRLDTRMRSLNNLISFDLEGNEDGFLLAIDAVRNADGDIVCGVNADADPSNDRTDCVPINVFGPGAPSQAALDFVNMTGIRDEQAEQFVASAFISGNLTAFSLPAGPSGFALGAEYRSEQAWSVFDELSAAGATFQNAIQPFRPPELAVKEIFAELRMPLLRGRRLAHDLTAEAAGRISDYDNETGTVSAWNAGLVYAPVPALGLRANLSTSVRVPTQGDLFRPLSQDFAFIDDPCDRLSIGNNPNRRANCADDGVPGGFEASTGQISFQTGGNPLLVEEEGESLTIGARYTPELVPGLMLAIDYYEIDVRNLIAPPSPQAILNSCYDSPSGIEGNAFCEAINPRTAQGDLAAIALIASGFNYARQVTEGIDLDLTYVMSFRNGHRLSTRLLATRVLELNNYLDPEDPRFADRVLGELGDPEFAFNLDLSYSIGNFELSYGLVYVDGQTIGFYEEQHSFNGNPPTDADIYPRVRYPSASIHSLRGEYAVGENLSVFAGVDNLTDSLPPLGLLGDAPGEPYDSIGRYFYVGLNFAL